MLTRNYFGADAMHRTKKRWVAKHISVMVVRCTNCCNVRAAYLEAVSDLFSASVAMIIYDQATLCALLSRVRKFHNSGSCKIQRLYGGLFLIFRTQGSVYVNVSE